MIFPCGSVLLVCISALMPVPKQKLTSVSEMWRNWTPHTLLGRNVKRCDYYGKQYGNSSEN